MCPKTRLEKLKGGLKAGRPWFIEAASAGGLPGRRGPLSMVRASWAIRVTLRSLVGWR